MPGIKHPLLYVGSKGEKHLYTLFDSAATLQKWRIKLDFEHDQVIVDPKVAKLQLI